MKLRKSEGNEPSSRALGWNSDKRKGQFERTLSQVGRIHQETLTIASPKDGKTGTGDLIALRAQQIGLIPDSGTSIKRTKPVNTVLFFMSNPTESLSFIAAHPNQAPLPMKKQSLERSIL